jgi:hypothetical protein
MSNEPTIEQKNEAIAKFMGYYYHSGKFYSNTIYPGRGNWFKVARYHNSWDWLMPVVRKIYDMLAEMLKKRPPHTACHGDMIEVDIHCAIREVNITKTHGYVYQFIQWYKKQHQMNKTLKLLGLILVLSACAFSQQKDSPLKIGESWEKKYYIEPGYVREPDYTPDSFLLIRPRSEHYLTVIRWDSTRRIYSILLKGDTATISIKGLQEILKETRWIKIGNMYFNRSLP